MTLPSEIRVQASCLGHRDLSGMIFELTVRSGTKSPYHIYFPQTDSGGVTKISADDFRGQFTDHYEMGLMDYNGTVETAQQSVTISLFDCGQMARQRRLLAAWPLLRHERTHWQSREQMLDYFLACRNDSFMFAPESFTLPADGQIHVTVAPNVA